MNLTKEKQMTKRSNDWQEFVVNYREKQMTKFIVFRQLLDKTSRINDVFGPCQSYEAAVKLAAKVRLVTDENLFWVGIRQVYPASDVPRVCE